MNLDDVREILALMRENGLSEFEIEHEGLRLRLRKEAATPVAPSHAGGAASVVAAAAHALGSPGVGSAPGSPASGQPEGQGSTGLPAAEAEIELAVVKSPIVGTFYIAPEPGAKPYAEVGDTVRKGQVLCIIEAMKLMNEINAECDGEVMKCYVDNGQAVQYGERLFAIKPS